MDLTVGKDTITSAGVRWEGSAELPVETEILIPDYMPPVFKIVKCMLHLVLLQKQVLHGRLALEGYLRAVVLYQADSEDGLCQTEQKIPFNRTMELPDGEYKGELVQVLGSTEYLNCRATNQRRMEIRGAYNLILSTCAVPQREIITQLAGRGIQQDSRELTALQNVVNLDKLVTCEEELEFPAPPQCVLDIQGECSTTEIKLLSGKAVIKGNTQLQVAYRAQPGFVLEQAQKELPFNQVVDLEGVDEDCICQAQAELIGSTLMSGAAPDQPNTVSVTLLLHLRVYRTMQCSAVTDAFSTSCQVETQTGELTLERQEPLNQNETQATVTLPLADEQSQLVGCFTQETGMEMYGESESVSVLRGRTTVHFLLLNRLGELECRDQTMEFEFPGQYGGAAADFTLFGQVHMESVQTQIVAGELRMSAKLRFEGMLLHRFRVTVLASVSCGEPIAPDADGAVLHIYYARAGESVFSIAKRYHASPAILRHCNGIEADKAALGQDACLLVPNAL